MRQILLIVVLCCPMGGCAVCKYAARTTITEPKYWHAMKRTAQRNREVAQCLWKDYLGTGQNRHFSEDYAQGFRDGVADYLDSNGSGEPPPVPPRRYWAARYKTRHGHRAILQWYDGFREGTCAANQTGCRRWVTVPSSLLASGAEAEYAPAGAHRPILQPRMQDLEVAPTATLD